MATMIAEALEEGTLLLHNTSATGLNGLPIGIGTVAQVVTSPSSEYAPATTAVLKIGVLSSSQSPSSSPNSTMSLQTIVIINSTPSTTTATAVAAPSWVASEHKSMPTVYILLIVLSIFIWIVAIVLVCFIWLRRKRQGVCEVQHDRVKINPIPPADKQPLIRETELSWMTRPTAIGDRDPEESVGTTVQPGRAHRQAEYGASRDAGADLPAIPRRSSQRKPPPSLPHRSADIPLPFRPEVTPVSPMNSMTRGHNAMRVEILPADDVSTRPSPVSPLDDEPLISGTSVNTR